MCTPRGTSREVADPRRQPLRCFELSFEHHQVNPGHGTGVKPRHTIERTRVRKPSSRQTFGYNLLMTTIPLGEARDRLSEVVAQVEATHDRIAITRPGRAAA